MPFLAAVCPQCSGALQVPDDRDVVKCMYCAVDVIVRQAIQLVPGNSKNLMELARSAFDAGNNKEAYDYFTRVLEMEPRNAEAWLGKGASAGRQSTLSDFRFNEMLVAFQNATKFGMGEALGAIQKGCAAQLAHVATACFKLARDQVVQCAGLNNSWDEYLERCRMILTLYEAALVYSPADMTIRKNIVHLCKINIEGLVYKDPRNSNLRKVHSLTRESETQLRTKLATYASALKNADADYVVPVPTKASSCFVVTATMGDEDHPYVCSLRAFRDETLMHTSSGRRFIAWYYAHGPAIADRIVDSRVLRAASVVLVVSPAVLLVDVYRALAVATRVVRRR